jgi:hypothetical protein
MDGAAAEHDAGIFAERKLNATWTAHRLNVVQ